jgi:hypothetical protein
MWHLSQINLPFTSTWVIGLPQLQVVAFVLVSLHLQSAPQVQ